nr:oligosaccharide flippase family protein [Pedococcus badiiscoriae]
MPSDLPLGRQVRRGLAWSVLGGILLRSTNLIVGIVMARLLAPEAFGVFAVSLTVMVILMAVSELGLTADLVKAADFDAKAPTITTLSVLTGGFLTLLLLAAAGPLASAMGTPSAAPVIRALSFVLLISGVAVEPYSFMLRHFQQKKIFATHVVAFFVSTSALVLLVLDGWGPMALAVSRLLAHGISTAMQFVLTGRRLRLGFRREEARSSLQFGLPVAGVNLIGVVFLGVDNIVIARVAGEVALGLYTLAFNISNWPTTIIGNAIAGVSLPAYARTATDRLHEVVEASVSVTWAAALFIGVALAALARPLIDLVYGSKWLPAAGVLGLLGLFGAFKVVADLMSNLLFSQGRSRAVMWVNLGSVALVLPTMIFMTIRWGMEGTGGARLLVAGIATAPLLLVALRVLPHTGAAVVRASWRPTLAAVPVGIVGRVISDAMPSPLASLVVGGTAMALLYVALLFHWVRPHVESALGRSRRQRVDDPSADSSEA